MQIKKIATGAAAAAVLVVTIGGSAVAGVSDPAAPSAVPPNPTSASDAPVLALFDINNVVKIKNGGTLALPTMTLACDTAYNRAYYSGVQVSTTLTQVINGRVYTTSGSRVLPCNGTIWTFNVSTSPRSGQPAFRAGVGMNVTFSIYGYYQDAAGNYVYRAAQTMTENNLTVQAA